MIKPEETGKRKTRIMFCGDSLNQTTGLTYVLSSIMSEFIKTGEIEPSYVTLSGNDSTIDGAIAQGSEFRELISGMKIGNYQILDREKAAKLDVFIEEVSPDIVFSMHDPWYLDTIAFSSYRDSFYWVTYVTIETPEYPYVVMSRSPLMKSARKPIRDILSRADKVIPVTSVGENMLKSHMKLENITKFCYNGLDYSLLAKEPVSKREAFGPAVSEDDFVFMTMGFNSERKRVDKTIEAFWKFKKKMGGQDKYKLYIHCDFNAPTGGTDLSTMCTELGLLDHILIPNGYVAGRGIEKRELYRRYKASDCYIGLPSGEGFGYGFAEAMMHGKPVIYIDYGGHPCYCAGRGLPVKVSDYIYAKNAYMKWAIADTDDAAKAMSRMVSDPKLYDRLSKDCELFARENLAWPIVFERIKDEVLCDYNPEEPGTLSGVAMKRLV